METNVFKGLMRKEWLLTRNIFILLICAMLFVWFIGAGWSVYHGDTHILLVVTTLIISVHVVYMTWIVGSGLKMEEKSQIWLHSPHSTSKLLGSKVLTGLYLHGISVLASLLLLALTVSLTNMNVLSDFEMESLTVSSILSIVVQITVSGLELAMFYMLFWTVYHAMGKFYFLNKYRVVLLTLFIVIFFMVTVFVEKQLLAGLETVWPVPIEMAKFMNVYIEEDGLGIRSGGETISLAGLILSMLKIIGLFSLSSWLLNKVVEVK